MFNWIRVMLNRIKVDKERRIWVKKLKRERFLHLAKGECCRDLHEPFLRVVDWPDDLIEEYYATITGWGFVFPEEKEENTMKKYMVKTEYADQIFGSECDTAYVEECMQNGMPEKDVMHLVREFGEAVLDQFDIEEV